VIALLLSGAAWAWVSTGFAWEEQPVPYWIDANLSPDVDDAAVVAAIREGVEAWNDIGCGVEFAYQGRHDGVPFGSDPDGRNVFYLPGDAWPVEATEVVSTWTWVHGDDLTEVDYAMNGFHYAWTTEVSADLSTLDVRGAAAEGAGHMLGLGHSDVEGATLHPAMVAHPEAATLAEDDIAGACAVYADPAVPNMGDPCSEPDDCHPDGVCVEDGDSSYCSRECATDDDCGGPWFCDSRDGLCALDTVSRCSCSSGASAAGWLAFLSGLMLVRRRAVSCASRSVRQGSPA